MRFSEKLATWDLRALRERVESATATDVERALSHHHASFADFLALMSPVAMEYLEPMAIRAREETIQRFGRVILLYAPLYLSNYCMNACVYCSFNRKNDIKRITVTPDELADEARLLMEQGFRHLLIVSGESPQHCPTDLLCKATEKVAEKAPSLSIEVQPLSREDYERVCAAGAEGVTLYQEVYDPDIYAAMHPAGPKRDYAARLDALDRAGEAGFRRLNIGSLLGLNDYRYEAIALCLHAEHLRVRFWQSDVALSLPRLHQGPEGFETPQPVSDAELVQLLLAMRIYMPDLGIVLSTREKASLRDHLMPLGITQMSAGSKTAPGAYGQHKEAGCQFEISDDRPTPEVAQAIRRAGYEPVWKDWDKWLHGRKAS